MTSSGPGPGSPTTRSARSAALRMVAYFIAGLRLATLVQMLPSFPPAVAGAEHPRLTVFTWALAAAMLVGVAVAVIVRRRPLPARWAVADVAVAVLLLISGLWTVPVDLRTGTWMGFQLAYTLCVAASLVGVRHRSTWLALLCTLTVTEAVYLAPAVGELSEAPSVLGNLLTVLVLAPLAWLSVGMIVRIGTEADEAREYAAEVARAEEERRARLAIHNGTAMLRLLVEQNDARDGPGGEERLRSQAEAEINRMRAYLTGRPPPRPAAADLAELVDQIARDFADLPLTVVADLARGVRLPAELGGDLDAAVRSLLLNVRQHAEASRVVLHAEEPADGVGWVVTLHDDGVGFDPARTPRGVGLDELVHRQLAAHRVEVQLSSLPGLGTTVTLSHLARSQAAEAAHDLATGAAPTHHPEREEP